MQCEQCKKPILIGGTFVMLHGRPWHPKHATEYLRGRATFKG